MALGGVLLAFNPGSGEPPDGAVDYHGLGAFASIVGGNVLVILLGRQRQQIGVTPKAGRVMVVLGVFGLASMVAFLSVASSGANVLIGLVERCAVYPILVGFICAGASIWNRRTCARSSGEDEPSRPPMLKQQPACSLQPAACSLQPASSKRAPSPERVTSCSS